MLKRKIKSNRLQWFCVYVKIYQNNVKNNKLHFRNNNRTNSQNVSEQMKQKKLSNILTAKTCYKLRIQFIDGFIFQYSHCSRQLKSHMLMIQEQF